LDKHHVAEAEQVFADPRLLVLMDEAHSSEEPRFHAYGQTAAVRLVLVSFTLRKDRTEIRVISARDMSRKEKARYAQEA
jgi:hypothetical protein